MHDFGIVIHGGAGAISKYKMTPELEKAFHAALVESLTAGYDILKEGGSSLEAVQKAVNVMEDCPLFNAGKGAVFNAEGKNELDSSIMDGMKTAGESSRIASSQRDARPFKRPASPLFGQLAKACKFFNIW